ncbi:MAG: RNA polymerase sigma factor [Planctomycetota bacterium]|jgi:RNA polymerase sigma-70 factor (ECF subfamily)
MDIECVQRAQDGDGEALQTLWRSHRRWVASILLAHKPRECDLEDLLQDVALSFLEGVAKLREPSRLRPWLRSVALNTARSAGRKATTRRVWNSMRRGQPETGTIATMHTEGGMAGEDNRVLELAMRLAPEYAEPLMLRAVRGMSQRQIAQTLDLPETTVETRLARARKMLMEEMAFANETDSIPFTKRRATS